MTHPEPSAVIQRRTVRNPTTELINGWRRVIEVELDWRCPRCGSPRRRVSRDR